MIRKLTIQFALFVTLLLTSASCHRQALEEVFYTKALIPVLIDWETRAVMDVENDPDDDLYSASVWLFPTEESLYQGDPLECKLTNAVYDYIEVPVGVYDVLVFNKTVGDYSANVGFRNTDQFETFEYYTNPYTTSTSSSVTVNGQESRLEPDLLAAWRSTEATRLVVTLDMIESMEFVTLCRSEINVNYFLNRTTSSKVVSKSISIDDFASLGDEFKQLLDLKPERITHIITVDASVTNLHSASSALGTMCGMSSSAKLAGAEYSELQTSQYFQFDTKTITSDDGKDGYMTAEYRVIGYINTSTIPDYHLKVQFTLIDTYEDSYTYPTPPSDPFSYEVTDQVYSGAEVMDLYKLIPLSIEDPVILSLPDLSVGGGGFDVNVGDWDDEINVPIVF